MSKHRLGAAIATFALAAMACVVAAGPANAATVADPAAGLAVSSWGSNRLDLFARGSDNTLQHRIFNGRWSSWESLGGALSSAPAAASWGPGRIDVFARSTTNSMLHRAYVNGSWAAWEDLGGGFGSGPAVASWGANRLDLFGIGTNNTMFHRAWNGTAWQANWDSLGGGFNARPTVASWGANRLDVFGRGANNALYHKAYAGSWAADWENLGGTLSSAPAATSWGSNRIDIFAAAGTGNSLYHKFWNGSWSAYENLGGTTTGDPTVDSWASGRLDIFYPGTNDTLMHKWFSGTWSTPEDLTAVPAPVATQPFASFSAVQSAPASGAAVGGLEYADVDNAGRIAWGHQPDPSNFGSVQWTVISGLEKFTGQPTLAEQPDGRLQIGAHNVSTDVWTTLQTAKGASTWSPFNLAGGGLAGHPALGKLPDGRLVLFGIASNGGLWALPQDSVNGAFGIWRYLGNIGLVGTPTIAVTRDGLAVFALDSAGALHSAAYSAAGTLSAWTDLGGSGLNGAPAVVVYPGFLMRVFVRSADGTIVTKAQNDVGAYPADWSPVGTFVAAGSPSAVLSPSSGRTELVARAADGSIYSTGETAQASGTWRDWTSVLLGGDVAGTDPTAFTFNNGSGQLWAFVFRTTNEQGRVYTVDSGAALTARAPSFGAKHLPTPAH